MSQQNHKKDQEFTTLPYWGLDKLYLYLKPYGFTLVSMVTLAFLGGLVDIILPLFQEYAIDHFIALETLDTLGGFVAAYLAILAFQVIANGISAYQACQLEMYVGRDMKRESFNHLQTLSFSYFNQNSVGYIHARVMSDTNRIGALVSWSLIHGVWYVSYLVGAIVVMLSMNAGLACWILALVPIIAVAAGFFQKKLIRTNRKIRETNSQITGNFNEGITGAKTTKTLVIEEKMEQNFNRTSGEMERVSVRGTHYRAMFASMISFASSTALALVLWQGGIITREGIMEIGMLSVFMSYALGLMEPVQWVV